MKITALAGGIGGAKLCLGLYRTMDPRDLTIIVNTGDDIVLHGLYISPDPDIVTYTLAGVVNLETGWGFRDETFHAMARLKAMGGPDWFNLGDKDLATHIHRTQLLNKGKTLTEAADSIRKAENVDATILPMTDAFAPTYLETEIGRLHLQEYLIKHRAEPKLLALDLSAAGNAEATPSVRSAIADADAIVICPSNPLISIGPILSVRGIRDALRNRRADCIAVCPLVGGKSLKGPSDKMLTELSLDGSAAGLAKSYADICGRFVIDSVDAGEEEKIADFGMEGIVRSTVMRSLYDREQLARDIASLFV
jgi:LPPG:FO 2-phospho-L-lactate transferase